MKETPVQPMFRHLTTPVHIPSNPELFKKVLEMHAENKLSTDSLIDPNGAGQPLPTVTESTVDSSNPSIGQDVPTVAVQDMSDVLQMPVAEDLTPQLVGEYVNVRTEKPYTQDDIGRVLNRETIDDVTFVTTITGISADGQAVDFDTAPHVKMTKFDTADGEGAVEGVYVGGKIFTNDGKTVRDAKEAEIANAAAAITAAKEKLREGKVSFSLVSAASSAAVADIPAHWADAKNVINNINAEDSSTEKLVRTVVEHAGSPVKTINGVDVLPLGEVVTPDGIKPFADGKIVGVFEQDDNKTVVERLGTPHEFITRNLEKAGVLEPKAWARGLNENLLQAASVESQIFLVNQQLRLRFGEYTDHPMTERMKRRSEIVEIIPEDWYRVAAALIIPAMVAMEPKAAPAAA